MHISMECLKSLAQTLAEEAETVIEEFDSSLKETDIPELVSQFRSYLEAMAE